MYNNLTILSNDVKKCKRCELYKQNSGDFEPMSGIIKGNGSVFFLLERPTLDNVILEDFSITLSDKIVNKIIEQLKIKDYYITYTLKCASEEYKKSHLNSCHHWLKEEIELIKPKLIIAFGVTPLSSLFDIKFKLKDVVNQIYSVNINNHYYKFLAQYSTNYLLQAGKKIYDKETWLGRGYLTPELKQELEFTLFKAIKQSLGEEMVKVALKYKKDLVFNYLYTRRLFSA